MAHHSDTEQDLGPLPKDAAYEKASKGVYKGMWLLAAVTMLEVIISLFGKGHLGIDPGGMKAILLVVAIGIIILSLYKAYYIIYEFMHMGHEVRSLRLTVLLPTLLLVWAIIAFFYEGSAWKENREVVLEKNAVEIEQKITPKLNKDVVVPATKPKTEDQH
jgi:cytochrome c oxidase subunit IV